MGEAVFPEDRTIENPRCPRFWRRPLVSKTRRPLTWTSKTMAWRCSPSCCQNPLPVMERFAPWNRTVVTAATPNGCSVARVVSSKLPVSGCGLGILSSHPGQNTDTELLPVRTYRSMLAPADVAAANTSTTNNPDQTRALYIGPTTYAAQPVWASGEMNLDQNGMSSSSSGGSGPPLGSPGGNGCPASALRPPPSLPPRNLTF